MKDVKLFKIVNVMVKSDEIQQIDIKKIHTYSNYKQAKSSDNIAILHVSYYIKNSIVLPQYFSKLDIIQFIILFFVYKKQ